MDRHDHHGERTDPRAHHPVTRVYGSGPVRFPVGLRRSRRSEELTPGDASGAPYCPDLPTPPATPARHRRHTPVEPVWLQDPACRARHEPLQTTIVRALAWVEAAIRHHVSVGVVVFDACSLAADGVRIWTRRRKDWSRVRTTNRLLDPARVHLRDANGWPLQLPAPHIAGEALVPRIPAPAYRPRTVGEHTSWCCTLAVRLPSLGKVRSVVSWEQETLTGRAVVLVTNRVDGSAAQSSGL